MTIKDKLEAYRRRKHKERMTESIKSTVGKMFSWNLNRVEQIVEESVENEESKLMCEQPQDVQDTEDASSEDNAEELKSTVMTKVIYVLYFLFWITMYVIALEYEFGAVYFILSVLVFICMNTRSGPKQRGEPSAYSVFNPNCEPIEGTVNATQLEREMICIIS